MSAKSKITLIIRLACTFTLKNLLNFLNSKHKKGSMRIQYRCPELYDFLISFIYPKKLLELFRQEVGKNKTVFEIAAGYGRMAKFIHSSNRYYGIDLNRNFVKFGRKKGLELEIKDIFDPQAYKKSDVYLVVDVVHHLPEKKLGRLFEMVFAHAKKKVIVIEPSFVNMESKYGVLGKLYDWFFKVIDYDGFNDISRWMTEKEYAALFQKRFGSAAGNSFSLRHQKIGNHHFAAFKSWP